MKMFLLGALFASSFFFPRSFAASYADAANSIIRKRRCEGVEVRYFSRRATRYAPARTSTRNRGDDGRNYENRRTDWPC
jgi:hypothetical protein